MPVWMVLSLCAGFLTVDVPERDRAERVPLEALHDVMTEEALPLPEQLAQHKTYETPIPGTPVAAFWFVDAR